MKTVHLLGHCSCFTRHLHPIRVFQKELLNSSLRIKYFSDPQSPGIEECDVLIFFDANYRDILPIKNRDRSSAITFLLKYLQKFSRVIWFDDHDSSGMLRTYIFPLVDVYVKAQLLKNKDYYSLDKLTGVIHRDFSSENYGVEDRSLFKGLITNDDLSKIRVGWSLGFNNWTFNNCYFPLVNQLIIRYLKVYKIQYCFLSLSKRKIDISYRGNAWSSMPTVHWWRKMTERSINNFSLAHPHIRMNRPGIVSKKEYHQEIKNSVISISPFGIGEICYRDFETFMFGSLLFKPNMDHLVTYPDLYQDGVTYIPHRWDFSDFEEKLEAILSHPETYQEIASEGQRRFKHAMQDGEGFARHFLEMIS